MTTFSLLAQLERHLQQALPRAVRANALRPSPPPPLAFHTASHLRMIIVMEGRKEETYSDGAAVVTWVLEPGDVLLVRPNAWISPRYQSRACHLGIVLAADRLRISWCRCDGTESKPEPLVIEGMLDLEMPERSTLKQIADALGNLDTMQEQESARHLVVAFLHLIHAAELRPQQPEEKGERTWRVAFAYIHDHCHLHLSRNQVARVLHMSPNYLSRLCRSRSGRSFIDILTDQRLARAATMLQTVEMPLAAVAKACGFHDTGHFIRRFRKSYGVTPGAYRRQGGAIATT
jgi:AraC-like DNA-binding protein